ncbi:isopeptide-forming domain-containing fimbrial protein [Firmicutes bacterium TM09-10]|nr:isopeptide-forming domain-containing fimbrial protein [Firmicutes bacterium TM09-10]
MERMKRMKKLLTGLLTLGMTLSMMTMTAFAADPSAKMPTIDTDKTGTVTIHKYTSGNGMGSVGNGTEADPGDFPTGAEPLKGAGFTLYQVEDKGGMEAYYKADPKDLPDVSEYVEPDGTIKKAYIGNATSEGLTDKSGTATFSNLELGFYVVIETTVPDAVTIPMKPFLLSVPMTTTDGSDWLYDIHVYPKNETGYGKISLEKTGVKDDEKISGATFALQKKSDADGKWINITKQSTAQGDDTGAALSLTTNNEGKITIEGLSKGEYRLIETFVGDGYIMDGATAYVFKVNADSSITYGTETNANITINVTNERPDLTKKVQKKNGGTWGMDADYSIGDEIPYKITVDVPKNITKLKTFTVTDTPTNLKDNLSSIKITCDGTPVVVEAYSTEALGADGFTIKFTPAQMEAYKGKQLVITYNATLKDTAFNTTAGNRNTAKLEYSKNITPNTTDDPDNPNKDKEEGKNTIENSTVVYTFAVKIEKTGEDGTTPLKDVKFDLYQEVDAETTGAITGASVPAGLDNAKFWKKIDTLTTDASGIATHNGLSNGTYYLVETKTNDGYNLLKKPIEVILNVQYTTITKTESAWVEDTNGQKQVKSEITETTFTSADSTTQQGIKVQKVINKKGFTLPTTGGIGTFVFTFAGIAMMAAAVILLITGKKKKAE